MFSVGWTIFYSVWKTTSFSYSLRNLWWAFDVFAGVDCSAAPARGKQQATSRSGARLEKRARCDA